MASVIGQILPEAIGIALSPIPIVGLILILFTKQARTNSLAYLAGWMLGLAVVGAIVLALVNTGRITVGEQTTDSGIKLGSLLLGLVLIFMAYRQWQKRPKAGETAETPKWMGRIDSIKPGAALGLGALLSGVNPKNLLINLAAAATIANSGLDSTQQIIVLIVFILIASITIIGPVLYFQIAGASAEKGLNELKGWLIQNNSAIMAVILLLLGAKFFGQGLGGF